MNLNKVKSDLDTRDPIFTIPSLTPVEADGQIPAAFIWSGLSRGGIDRYLPVLFDYTNSKITSDFFERYGNFSATGGKNRSIRPIIYQESNSPLEPITIEIPHWIKPVTESEVDTDIENAEDVRGAARDWERNYSKSLTYDRLDQSYGFLYRLEFKIYGARFQALLPIFAGKPSEDELLDGLQDALIPCVAIVPDHVDTEGNIDNMEVQVEPTIFGLGK